MDRDTKMVLMCEESLRGVFTAIYDGWKYAVQGYKIEICTDMQENMELFSVYQEIVPDDEKAQKVGKSIRKKLGMQVYEDICYAIASNHPEKGTAVFYVLRLGFAAGRCNKKVMEALGDPYVNLVAKLRTKVWNEIHRFLGFVRFQETGGILFSKISPENDILIMLSTHFENRFPREYWMIYDEKRKKVLVHKAGEKCMIYTDVEFFPEKAEYLKETDVYETLWKTFCQSIEIKERRNRKLQQQLVPKKFQMNMIEMNGSK